MSRSKTNRPLYGGANKDMKKFPSIRDYLEIHHKDIYEIISDLGLLGNLTPRHGNGVTLLLPDDKMIKKLKAIVVSADPEEASDIVFSLILPIALCDAGEWQSNKANVANLLRQKLPIKEIKADTIVLTAGSISQQGAKKFVPFKNRKNMCVWSLTGEVGTSNPAAEVNFGQQKKKTGGFVETDSTHADTIEKFKNIIREKEKALVSSTGRAGAKSYKLRVLCNAMHYCTGPEAELLAAFCTTAVAGVESAFYILFSAYDRNVAGRQKRGLFTQEFLVGMIGDCDKSRLCAEVDKPWETYCKWIAAHKKPLHGIDASIDRVSMGVRPKTCNDIKRLYVDYVHAMPAGALKQRFAEEGEDLIASYRLFLDYFMFECSLLWETNMQSNYDPNKITYNYITMCNAIAEKAVLGLCCERISMVERWSKIDGELTFNADALTKFFDFCWINSRERKLGGAEEELPAGDDFKMSEVCKREIAEFLRCKGHMPTESDIE